MAQNYTSLNVLFSTNTSAKYIPPVPLSMKQVVCGPQWETQKVLGHYVSIKTPTVYDIAAVAAGLPQTQTPDLVVVRTDAHMANVPTNLAGIRCPKVLLYADTYHCHEPIQSAFRYLNSEKYDFIIILYDKQHVHWFREAGHENVYFMPGLEVEHVPVDFSEDRQKSIVFVGQFGKYHLRRKWRLDQMSLRGYPLRVEMMTRRESARVYAQSQISFNCSLNGDLNMRVFEVLSAGGFLLTDKLSRQAGLDQVFEDGRHMVCYRDQNDLFAKLDYYLAHPDEALAIARQGHAECLRRHLPEHRVDSLLRLIFEGERPVYNDFSDDPRACLPPTSARTELRERTAIYEFFQEVHLHQESVYVLCCGATHLACDLADLYGLELAILQIEEFSDSEREALARAGVQHQVQIFSDNQARSRLWDALLLDADRLGPSFDRLLSGYQYRWLVLSRADADRLATLTQALAAKGWRLLKPGLPLFERLQRTSPVRTAPTPAVSNQVPSTPWKWS